MQGAGRWWGTDTSMLTAWPVIGTTGSPEQGSTSAMLPHLTAAKSLLKANRDDELPVKVFILTDVTSSFFARREICHNSVIYQPREGWNRVWQGSHCGGHSKEPGRMVVHKVRWESLQSYPVFWLSPSPPRIVRSLSKTGLLDISLFLRMLMKLHKASYIVNVV